jgi:hypothetical protein
MQLLEIENEELKKRLIKLTAPEPQPFYMQQWKRKDGTFGYMIFDVGGNHQLTFTTTPEQALAFFEQYKKTPPTVKSTVILHGYSDGLFTSLKLIEQRVADVTNLKITEYKFYSIYFGNSPMEFKRTEGMPKKDAINWYAQYVSDYLDNNVDRVEGKTPDAIFQ